MEAENTSGRGVWLWRESRAARHVAAVGLVLLAMVVRLLLNPLLGQGYAYVLFYPVVLIVGTLSGFWAGLAAAACFAAFSVFRLIPYPPDTADLTALGIFVGCSALMSFLGGLYRRSRWEKRSMRRRATQERRLAEQSRLLDLSNDAIVVCDAQERITYWNRGAVELYGYSRDEALGRLNHELLRTQFPEQREVVLEKLHRDGRWIGELGEVRKDGTLVTVISRWVLDRDAEGRPSSILKTSNDISERKRAEKELRESRAILQQSLSAETVGVLFFSLDGGIKDANSTFARMCGYSRDELIHSQHWKALTAPEFIEPTMRVARQLAGHGKAHPYEKQMVRRDGSRWWGLFAPTRLSGSGTNSQCMEFVIDITERKRAEQALHESEERYRAFIANSSEGVWRMEFNPPVAVSLPVEEQIEAVYRNGHYAECNDAMAHMYGLRSAAELVSKTLDFMLPQNDPASREFLAGIISAGYRVSGVESAERNAEGQTVYFSNSMMGTVENGYLTRIWGIQRDITKSKLAEEALLEQLELTRTITDNATTAIFMMDEKSRCTFMNPAAELMTGFRFEEVSGGILHHFIHHHRPDGTPFPVEECLIYRALPERFDVRSHEDTFIRKNGEFFPVLVNARPICRDGHGVGTVIEVRDVTDQKRAEAAARENESILRAVTREAGVGLVILNKEQRYLFANQTYAEIVGQPESSFAGQTVDEVVPPACAAEMKPRLERALAGERVTHEIEVPHPRTGERRYYEVTCEPRRDRSGPYVVVVFVDITERKARQETLERTVAERTAKLAETVQQLETFSYSVVHDMRAPLRSMRSFATLLAEEYGPQLDETARTYLERLKDSASRMDALITDVLSFSRVSASEAALARVKLDTLVDEIVQHYPQFQESRGLIHIMAPLPAVQGNHALLTQVISNLLGNALKFVPAGRTPKVVIRAERKNGNIRLWIEDNGIGIEPRYHEKVFGLFQRLHRPDEYPGTGVGLAIVKKAAERMGGQVGFESAPGAGSRFWIELPTADETPGS